MTTRDTTPILTRSWDGEIERRSSDWMRLLAFGAVQWPWLLKSLYGGRKADKAALLSSLGLPHDALPNLGSWKADVGLLRLLVGVIARSQPQTMVELGAGASTLVAAKALSLHGGGRLVSFDQHADFVEETRKWVAGHGLQVDLRHAPLTASDGQWRSLWYDLNAIPEAIDLLLIDGPPWTVNPTIRGRAEILFGRVRPGGVVLLDDAARLGERFVARQWRRDWPDFDWTLLSGIKGCLMGVRRH